MSIQAESHYYRNIFRLRVTLPLQISNMLWRHIRNMIIRLHTVQTWPLQRHEWLASYSGTLSWERAPHTHWTGCMWPRAVNLYIDTNVSEHHATSIFGAEDWGSWHLPTSLYGVTTQTILWWNISYSRYVSEETDLHFTLSHVSYRNTKYMSSMIILLSKTKIKCNSSGSVPVVLWQS